MAKRMKRIRIGVAGLGRIGWRFHCAQADRSRGFDLVAVADTHPERRAEAEQTYGCAAFEDYDTMLDQADLEAVVVATPTHLHNPHALAAFRRGLHVLLEKPMAPDLAEARSIARAAKRAGRLLTVYQPQRVAAYFQTLLRVLRSGRIGEVYEVRIGWFNWVRRNDWQSLRRYGGGILNNYGAHMIDQALAITGADVKKVFCNLRRVATMGDAEDVVSIVYETRKRVVAELTINQATPLNPFFLEVYGTLGGVSMTRTEITVKTFSPSRLKAKELNPRLASEDRRYPSDEVAFDEETVPVDPSRQADYYRNFARAVRYGEPLLVTPQQTLNVMKLMQRCREDSGRIVSTTWE